MVAKSRPPTALLLAATATLATRSLLGTLQLSASGRWTPTLAPQVAMEVAPNNAPIAITRESEGLQAWDGTPSPGRDEKYGFVKRPTVTEMNRSGYQHVDDDAQGVQRRLCGFRPSTFWILAVLIFAVVAIGAVGGGIGSQWKAAEDRAAQW